MLPRTHWVRIQRSIYARLKAYARQFLGGLTPELQKYFAEYHRDFRTYQSASSKEELLSELQRSQVVFCGDYHTLSQAQRTVIRLLRDLLPKLKHLKIKPILAIEMARPRDNQWLDAFLSRKISEAEFLARIGFRARWGFPWENYRQVLHFAREHGIRVAGINLSPNDRRASLRERDKFAADIIAKLCLEDSKHLVFTLIGDLHLAQGHLPGETRRALEKLGLRRKTVVVHQNSEKIYWKLVEKGLEHKVDVVKIRRGTFCVMNTPPWVKLQSHLRWAEQVSASGTLAHDIAGAERFLDEDLFDDSIDYSDDVRELLEAMTKFLGLPPHTGDDFLVMGPGETEFLDSLRRKGLISKKQAALLLTYLWEFESHFIPHGPIVFLKSGDVNHLSTQAMHYLHQRMSGFSALFESPSRDFYRFIWVEALGFFGSKIINHKRKCNGPKDLATMARQDQQSSRTRRNAKVAAYVLELLGKETAKRPTSPKLPTRAEPHRVLFFYKAAKALGRLLGEAMYRGVMENKITREEVKKILKAPLRDAEAARRLYFTWIRRLDAHGYREVHKRDRL